MQLGLTEDQQAIREVFASFFAKEAPPTVARAAEPGGFDAALWGRLLETGAPAMGVPEAHGGGGAGLGDLAVVATEVGRNIAPVPFVDHAVAARLLAAAGAPAELIGLAVDAAAPVALALHPAVDGTWSIVPAGAVAELVVGLDGDDLVALRSAAPGSGPRNHGAMPIAHRSSTDGQRHVLASGDLAHELHGRALSEWKTLTAAALVGIGEAALAIGKEYVMARHQFGKPIGSFQAVQQGMADLPILCDGAFLLMHKAAWAGDQGADSSGGGTIDVGDNDITDFDALASMAFVFASDTAAHATDRSLHYHGGYGFSEEYDIQLYYRRARGWALVYRDPTRECVDLADLLFPAAAR
jgi:alkylation response protein AidB-like acyl-CoA dehydrogenase